MIDQTSSIAPAIINAHNWRSNCCTNQVGTAGENLHWTVFPAPIGLGATFDTILLEKSPQMN